MGKAQRVHYTWDDYVLLPDDGQRYEILEGDLVVMAAPSTWHQLALAELYFVVSTWSRVHAGGLVLFAPVDVVLAEDVIVQPDLIWVAPERVPEIVEHVVRGIPDLVVEVQSPSTARRDQVRKADIYARYGAREYWLVNPADESVEIRVQNEGCFVNHATGRGETVLTSSLDEALKIVPAQLFKWLPAKRR